MERLPSLINSLKSSYEAGKSNAELLNLLEEMRLELTGSRPVADNTVSRVSVWLPAGYQPLAAHSPKQTTIPEVDASETEITPVSPFISESLRNSIHLPNPHPVEVAGSAPAASLSGVPKPPQVTIVEEPEPLPQPEVLMIEENSDDFILPGNFHLNAAGLFREMKPESQAVINRSEDETPVVVELKLTEETEMEMPVPETQSRVPIPEGFLSSAPIQDAGVAVKPRELHEILANRVVAQPLNGEGARQPTVLADKLSGTKITDLRKGIAINDRFRFIHSLFRGDDTLFERSVKTINNFSILQEAQYWIQRELVIKLGWNEEDELVQLFYQLVSRRFL